MKYCVGCFSPLPDTGDGRRSKFCSVGCHRRRAPAVYRWICPDGRSYIGSTPDCRTREQQGVGRKNKRLISAFVDHPPKLWAYEVLQRLPPGCSGRVLQEAEQIYIDKFRSYLPECGFNVQRIAHVKDVGIG